MKYTFIESISQSVRKKVLQIDMSIWLKRFYEHYPNTVNNLNRI